jgi:hypothetical protein
MQNYLDGGSWVGRLLESGNAPSAKAAFDDVAARDPLRAELWRHITTKALATYWPEAAAETIGCDILHRGIYCTAQPKPFGLRNLHALGPKTVAQFERGS